MFAIKVEDESDESSILEREIKVLIELRCTVLLTRLGRSLDSLRLSSMGRRKDSHIAL